MRTRQGVRDLNDPNPGRHPDRPFRPYNCAHLRMRAGGPCGTEGCGCRRWRVECPDCGFTWDNSEGVYG